MAFRVFGLGVAEFSAEAQDDLVIHPFEEVFLGRLGDQAVHISQGVLFIPESIIRRNDDIGFFEHNRLVVISHRELDVMVILVIIISELVHT